MGEIATLMRMGFYVDPRKQPGVKAYVDREFIGVSEPDLHLQIRYYITKYGIAEAFNIKIQENTDEESERST